MNKLIKHIQKIEKILGTFFVAMILIVMTMNIFMRYVFRSPLNWTDEMSRFSLIWMTFLSITYLFADQDHVTFTSVIEAMSPKKRSITAIISYLIIAITMIILLPSSINNMPYMIPSPSLRIPEQYVYAIVPISYALIAFMSFVHIMNEIKTLKSDSKEEL